MCLKTNTQGHRVSVQPYERTIEIVAAIKSLGCQKSQPLQLDLKRLSVQSETMVKTVCLALISEKPGEDTETHCAAQHITTIRVNIDVSVVFFFHLTLRLHCVIRLLFDL